MDKEPEETVKVELPPAIKELFHVLAVADPFVTVRPQTPQELLDALLRSHNRAPGFQLSPGQLSACVAWLLNQVFTSHLLQAAQQARAEQQAAQVETPEQAGIKPPPPPQDSGPTKHYGRKKRR